MSREARDGLDTGNTRARDVPDDIPALRARIEELDRTLVEEVAERVDLARRIGEIKRATGSATLDPEREAAVIRRAVETARQHGLPAEGVREIFWSLMALCRGAQLEDS